jgi:hypothetical protein
MSKQRPQRCDARTRRTDAARDRAAREGRLADYLRRSRERCRNWPIRGKKRCRLHGGLSTGPTTPEGLARTIVAMKAGRRRWLARLKSEDKPIPYGRKKGSRNAPLEEREHAAYVRQWDRKYRDMVRRGRAERKARRAQRRQEREDTRRRMAEHARRKARMDAGLPYWTEEEWQRL